MTEESDGLNLTKRNNFIVNQTAQISNCNNSIILHQTARIFHRNDSTN